MSLLFIAPTSPSATQPLVGIAKAAALSPQLIAKRAVEYYRLPSKSILNRCDSPRMPFAWTINPYRGCEFGCKYCYARYTHEYMGMDDPSQFEEKIYAKERAGEILRDELAKASGGAIAIGTATDPYQPAERRLLVTRSILETIAQFRGVRLSITTKSDLIQRDVELLSEINQHNDLTVNMTVTTMDEELARCLEPKAPRPALRIAAAAAIARAGIPVEIFAMPVLPGITDSAKNLEGVAKAAASAEASNFAVNVLFLTSSSQKAFYPFLEEKFPELVAKYKRHFSEGAGMQAQYRTNVEELARRLRIKYGLKGSQRKYPVEAFAPAAQMILF